VSQSPRVSDTAVPSSWRAHRTADRSNLDRNQNRRLWCEGSLGAGPGFTQGFHNEVAAWTVELSRVLFEVLKGDS
jgi:hypothetical protein